MANRANSKAQAATITHNKSRHILSFFRKKNKKHKLYKNISQKKISDARKKCKKFRDSGTAGILYMSNQGSHYVQWTTTRVCV